VGPFSAGEAPLGAVLVANIAYVGVLEFTLAAVWQSSSKPTLAL
jgi:hypothetical protein